MTPAEYWLRKNCVRRSTISGGVVVLLRRMNQDLKREKEREYSLPEFRDLLKEQGFALITIAGTLLVPGIGLREDWDFYHGEEENR
jgi:hypothetical protein